MSGADPGGTTTAQRPERASQWAARAELAERAVRARHLRKLWALPGTLLGVSAWPASPAQRVFGPWNYWWQAQVLDCLVDAYERRPDSRHRTRVTRFVNGIRRRNGKDWLNDYYDDMTWLALALQRAEQYVGVRRPGAVPRLAEALKDAWTQESGGGIWWRLRDKYDEDFKNVPANGPAAILFARLRDERGYETARWIEANLVDPQTGVVWDGLHVGPDGAIREVETTAYTYCQGVYLGACLELASWGNDGRSEIWAERASRTVTAVASHLTTHHSSRPGRLSARDPAHSPPGDVPGDSPLDSPHFAPSDVPWLSPGDTSRDSPRDGGEIARDERGLVLRGQGGGDGGLFAGILARYLAQAALLLPKLGRDFEPAAFLASELVMNSARAAWRNRTSAPGGPLFGPDWSTPADAPRPKSAERDLSVQTGAWMLFEAAALLSRSG